MKKFLFCIVTLLLCLTLPSCALTIYPERGIETAEEIATEEFGMQKVYTIGTAPEEYWPESSRSHYLMAVIGEKDGEELFLIVPGNYDEAPFLAPWPFALSFKEMIDLLNKTDPATPCTESDYRDIDISPQAHYYLADINWNELLDFNYLMIYKRDPSHYVLGQSNGEVIVIDTATQSPVL